MTQFWVTRIKGWGDDPWAPNIPNRWTPYNFMGAGIPCDKVTNPGLQTPLTTHLLIDVPAPHDKDFPNGVDPALVSQADKLMIQMIRDCGTEYEANAEAFFASMPGLALGNAALKDIAKELLLQAKARGLSPAKAEDIRQAYDLPSLTSVSA